MNPVRVLLVFSSSQLGGAERSLTRMAIASGEEVEYTLSTLDGPGPWVDWCHEMGVEPVVLGNHKVKLGHGKFGIKEMFRLVYLVHQQQYDILYVIGFRASVWLRLMRSILPEISLVQGVRWNPESGSWLDRIFRFVERFSSNFVDHYICNARATSTVLEIRAKIPSKKVTVIYNGLDNIPLSSPYKRRRSQNVVVLANLSPRKGHMEFLDVIKAVSRRLPTAHFYFVGRDDMSGALEKEVADREIEDIITITGYQADVGQWLRKSQLMVLPSLWGEGCPTSILEGFAYGLPVIAYAIDGIPELINDGKDGYLVTPGDTATMIGMIIRILEDPRLATSMGMAGRRKVESIFTLEKCAKKHSDVFADLVKYR